MEWISVEDRLPECSCYLLVVHKRYYPYNPIKCVYDPHSKCFTLGLDNFFLPRTIALDITHWMPLPETPDA